jgi:hypothetical protein
VQNAEHLGSGATVGGHLGEAAAVPTMSEQQAYIMNAESASLRILTWYTYSDRRWS